MNTAGAVLLGKPAEQVAHERRQLTNLIRVGNRLAVLGVEDGARSMGWWHVVRPGSFDAPQGDPGGSDQEGRNLTYGKSLCGLIVVSNGYAADWRPPKGQLCPACAEQI
jgi:hypothetical protein